MKKKILIIIALMVFIMPITLTIQTQKAQANVITKPFVTAGKYAAKQLGKNRAVNMAEEIVSSYMIDSLLGSIDTSVLDNGYEAVCIGKKVKDIEDCPPEKRAQVKKKLTKEEYNRLENVVEKKVEVKTYTSSKWQKFLDFFIPIFLANGAVAVISSLLDDDSSSLIDEIAYESLLDTAFIKPLRITEYEQIYNFNDYIDSYNVTHRYDNVSRGIHTLEFTLKPNKTITWNWLYYDGIGIKNGSHTSMSLDKIGITTFYSSEIYSSGTDLYIPIIYQNHETYFNNKVQGGPSSQKRILLNKIASPQTNPNALSYAWSVDYVNDLFSGDANNAFNNFLGYIDPFGFAVVPSVPKIDQTKPVVPSEIDKFKPENPKKDEPVKMPGVGGFDWTHNKKPVIPDKDSTTGWKDQTTGEDIVVNPDDVVVTPKPETPDTTPTDDVTPDKDKEKDKLKDESESLGALLTTRFPFSLPWDFLSLISLIAADPKTPEWEIKGTEKIPFNLKLNLKFMDSYAPWFRSFIMIGFVISVIFMHSRFMGGSK